jgi:hypothetical protein
MEVLPKVFEHIGKEKVTYSHHQHTYTQTRYCMCTYITWKLSDDPQDRNHSLGCGEQVPLCDSE